MKGRTRLHCYRRWKQRDCDQPTVQQAPIQAQILEYVKDIRPSDEEIPQLLQRLAGDVPDLTWRRGHLEKKLQRLKNLYLETGDLTLEEYDRQKREIQRELALLEPAPDRERVRAELLRYLTNFEDWWTDAADDERNDMLRHILTTVEVDAGTVTAFGFMPEAHCLVSARTRWSTDRRNTSNQPGSAGA